MRAIGNRLYGNIFCYGEQKGVSKGEYACVSPLVVFSVTVFCDSKDGNIRA